MNKKNIIKEWNELNSQKKNALMWLVLNGKTEGYENPFSALLNCRYVDGKVQPHAGYPVGHIDPELYSLNINSAWAVWMWLVDNDRSPILGEGDFEMPVFIKLKNPDLYILAEEAPDAICIAGLIASTEKTHKTVIL